MTVWKNLNRACAIEDRLDLRGLFSSRGFTNYKFMRVQNLTRRKIGILDAFKERLHGRAA